MSKKDDALKLAMDWYDSGNENPDDFANMIKQVIALSHAPEVREQPAQQQDPVDTDWDAVHEKLIEVWNRQISADEGLDEIQDLIYTSPQPSKPLLASDIVAMYDENPRSDSEMIAFARAIEAAHGIMSVSDGKGDA